jgi:hypothetical protein
MSGGWIAVQRQDLEEITAAADRVDVQGERYPAHKQRWINRWPLAHRRCRRRRLLGGRGPDSIR